MPNKTQRRHVLTGSPSALDNLVLFAGLDGCSFRIFAMMKRLVAGAVSDLVALVVSFTLLLFMLAAAPIVIQWLLAVVNAKISMFCAMQV